LRAGWRGKRIWQWLGPGSGEKKKKERESYRKDERKTKKVEPVKYHRTIGDKRRNAKENAGKG